MMSLKMILILGGLGFVMLMTIIFLTAPPKQSTDQQNTDSQNSTPANSNTSQRSDEAAKKLKQLPATELPSSYRRFTNKLYNFSVAFPTSWGALAGETNVGNTTLTVRSQQFNQPIGQSQAIGSFEVAIYPLINYTFSKLEGGSIIKPVGGQDGVYEWEVASLAYGETKLKLQDKIDVSTFRNTHDVVVYDTSWTTTKGRQNRWVFRSQDFFIAMSLPPLSRADNSLPSQSELKQYNQFANTIINSISLPAK